MNQQSLERIRSLVEERLGLQFPEARRAAFDEAVRQGQSAAALSTDGYVRALEFGGEELERLVEALTNAETYFFRQREQFQALEERVLPERRLIRRNQRRLRLLSAGCASGEEAYTVAMVLRRQAGLEGWDLLVQGVDLSAASLAKARRARYGPASLRETRPQEREAGFRPLAGDDVEVRPEVQALVGFEQRNLADPESVLWPNEHYDAVFCRNVIVDFSPAAARTWIGRVARLLVPGGYLFLGHAETLRGVSGNFDLCHTHVAFYYRLAHGAPHRVPPWDAAPTDPDAGPGEGP